MLELVNKAASDQPPGMCLSTLLGLGKDYHGGGPESTPSSFFGVFG